MLVRPFTISGFGIILILLLCSCQRTNKNISQPAKTKDININKRINPEDLESSVIETVPLMNNAVKQLYLQAQNYYANDSFSQAIISLERAYEIQPQAPEISQYLAEILLLLGNSKQAHYWAEIATKNGPARGKICAKSWRILAIAAEQLGYLANRELALEKQQECLVKPPNRY